MFILLWKNWGDHEVPSVFLFFYGVFVGDDEAVNIYQDIQDSP